MGKIVQLPVWFQYPKLEWRNKHAIVIGGGIAGAQIAWHLSQNNWQVTLIERHRNLASEASGNPAGVISPKMTAKESIGEDFYTQSFHYTLTQLECLKQLGHNINMENCGVIQLAHNVREKKRWQALKERNLSEKFIQLLDEEDTVNTSGITPHPTHQYKSCYFPEGGWIEPASFVKALIDHPNCKVINKTTALEIIHSDHHWHIYDSDQQLIAQSEVAIIANGKDLFSFKQSDFLPRMTVAGQTTSATTSALSSKIKTVIGHEGYFTPVLSSKENTPHTSSNTCSKQIHIFGATFDRNDSNPKKCAESDARNLDNLKKYLPTLADSLTELSSAHIAVRMTTPDRFPYVGMLPEETFYQESYHDLHQGKQWKQYPKAEYKNGLFVLGGLGSRGIITSGFCAKALCDLLENKVASKKTQQVLLNCHPARLIIKKLKKNPENKR